MLNSIYNTHIEEVAQTITSVYLNLIISFATILHHKTCPFLSRELSLEHEDRKGDFKRKRSNKHRRTHGCPVR